MITAIHKFIPMDIPKVTHQQKRVNFQTRSFYEDKRLASARDYFMIMLKSLVPEKPLEAPILLKVMWCFYTKDKRKWDKYKTTRPDLDNHQKLLQDCMTKLGFWQDDAQIATLIITKIWDMEEGIEITAYTL